MRGFFSGRFQPFHHGHAEFVDVMTDEVDEIVLAVGSAGRSHTMKNPFTAGERLRMIKAAVTDVQAPHYVIPVTDIPRHAMWVSHVESLCPAFEVVYTNNPLVDRLFSETGYDVRGMELINRAEYQGTEIRQRILRGDEWRYLVPDAVVGVIEEIDGVSRLRAVGTAQDTNE